MFKYLVLFFILLFSTCLLSEDGTCIRVKDGDTIVFQDDKGKQSTVRLYGIDAPETHQLYGRQSAKALTDRIENKSIRLVPHSRDYFGRIVGQIYILENEKWISVNVEMIRTGNAWWFRKYSNHETEYFQAEQVAISEKQGLWKSKNPVPPWEWRKDHK